MFSYPRVTCFVKGPGRGVGYHWEQNTTIRYIQSEKAGLLRNKKWKEQWKEGRREWENEVKDREREGEREREEEEERGSIVLHG